MKVVVNNPMCDMVNDAFGYHQHSNDMVDDREINGCIVKSYYG